MRLSSTKRSLTSALLSLPVLPATLPADDLPIAAQCGLRTALAAFRQPPEHGDLLLSCFFSAVRVQSLKRDCIGFYYDSKVLSFWGAVFLKNEERNMEDGSGMKFTVKHTWELRQIAPRRDRRNDLGLRRSERSVSFQLIRKPVIHTENLKEDIFTGFVLVFESFRREHIKDI